MSIQATTNALAQNQTLFDVKHSADRKSRIDECLNQIKANHHAQIGWTPEQYEECSKHACEVLDLRHDDVLKGISLSKWLKFREDNPYQEIVASPLSTLSDTQFLSEVNALRELGSVQTDVVDRRIRFIRNAHPECLPEPVSLSRDQFMVKLALGTLKLNELWGIRDEALLQELAKERPHCIPREGRYAGTLKLLSPEQKQMIRDPELFSKILRHDRRSARQEYLLKMDKDFLNEQLPKLSIYTLQNLPLEVFSIIDLSRFEVETLKTLLDHLQEKGVSEQHFQVIRDYLKSKE